MTNALRVNNPLQQLEQAIALHQVGNIAQAKAMYLQLLPVLSKNPDLYRLLGTAEYQLGNAENALKLLDKSLTLAPKQADVYNNRGNALNQLDRSEEALASFDRALKLNPNYPEAQGNRAAVLRRLKRFHEALDAYDAVLAKKPDLAELHNNRGNLLRDMNRMAEALQSFDRAIALNPDYADAYNNRGNVHRDLGDMAAAMADYDCAIRLRALQTTDASEATAEFYNNRGNLLRDLRRFDAALAHYDNALARKPDYVEALVNRSAALRDLHRFVEALAACDTAIALNPTYAEAHSHRGNALRDLHRLEEALAAYEQAITLKPDYAEALTNRGIVLGELRQFDAANASYAQALAVKEKAVQSMDMPVVTTASQMVQAVTTEMADAYLNKAIVKLVNGEFEEGFRLYEWRWKTKQFPVKHKDTSKPLWLGDADIRGKTLLVYPEQGLGDFIQFVRYVKLLEAMGAQVLLEVPTALVNLIAGMEGNFSILPFGSLLPDFDYHCPIMSLPLACRTTLANVPAAMPYLFADEEKSLAWQTALGTKKRPRVGVVWSGIATHLNDHNRSIALEKFQTLFAAPAEFHALQKEFRAADLAIANTLADVHLHAEQLHDFTDTAALVAQMDLVISVDTSVAHLAAAMGKPVWLLLPFAPDYRWLLHRDDTPWYPTMRLWRQSTTGDWETVLQQVREALERV